MQTPTNRPYQGFIWGADSTDLVAHGLFDVVILADLVFNHSQVRHLSHTQRILIYDAAWRAPQDLRSSPPPI